MSKRWICRLEAQPFAINSVKLDKNSDHRSYYDTIANSRHMWMLMRFHFVLPFARLTVNVKIRLFTFVTACFVSVSFTYTIKPFEHTSIYKFYKLNE